MNTSIKSGGLSSKSTDIAILTLELKAEHDVVYIRQRVREVARFFGFDNQDQTRIATAVSEITRNAFKYAKGGRVEFALSETDARQAFVVRVKDSGQGIPHLTTILEGRYVSQTGMGLGIIGSKRIMDVFTIQSTDSGTTIALGKFLPTAITVTPKLLSELVTAINSKAQQDPFQEIQQQNQDLLRSMEELRNREEALKLREQELEKLNHELEDTNRGVVALYAELDEKADYLQRANEIKTRFLSNMTHEFRTPLNSILSLSRLLLDRVDGPLTEEQEKQVHFTRKSAEDLSELVNDLLDIAKVEAGKVQVRASEFSVSDLFAALRGMLKPLLADNFSVRLIFDEVEDIPPLETDEGKLSQILRNFISNALKFTEKGEVRVSAKVDAGNTVVFEVRDTGIGIATEDQEKIFEEFSQIDSALQARSKGTGLGLPLSRRLASLLGGSVLVQSEPRKGSTFSAVLPMKYRGPGEISFIPDLSKKIDPTRAPVLVIEDNKESVFIYEKYLKTSGFQVIPARTLKEARLALEDFKPVAIIADILLQAENTWGFIAELKSNAVTKNLPVIVITMVDNEKKARVIGANAFHTKPVDRDWLLNTLVDLTKQQPKQTILLIDDNEVSRYLLKALLPSSRFRIVEATNAADGIRMAEEEIPSVIFLDLSMPDKDGFATLKILKDNALTQSVPVIIHSSKTLSEEEIELLEKRATAIVSKESASREVSLERIQIALEKAGLGQNSEQRILK